MPTPNDAASDALLKALEELFDKLQKKGLLPAKAADNKKDIIQSLAKSLAGKVEPKDLKDDPLVRMRTTAAMIGKGFGNDKFASIFTNALEKNPKGKPNELDKLFLTLMSMLKLEKNEPDKNLKMNPLEIAKKTLKPYFEKHFKNKKDPKASKEDQIKQIQFEDSEIRKYERMLAQAFGGVAPGKPGSVPDIAMLAAAEQASMPFTQFRPDATSTADVVKKNTYNPGEEDSGGLEAALKDEGQAQGILEAQDVVSHVMEDKNFNGIDDAKENPALSPTPFATKPSPFGSNPP